MTMTKLPLTRNPASDEKQKAIRNAVRRVRALPAIAELATREHARALFLLLADPAISDPIYTLPKPVTRVSVGAFIDRHLEERDRGEGLLLIALDDQEAAAAYHDIQFWPQWAACELGGAIRGDLQNAGAGVKGAAAAFGWLFDEIGVDVVCETAALDNVRTKKLLETLGFKFVGEIESQLPGGGARPSLYWEITRDVWRAQEI